MTFYYASKRDTLIQRVIASKIGTSLLGKKKFKEMQKIPNF